MPIIIFLVLFSSAVFAKEFCLLNPSSFGLAKQEAEQFLLEKEKLIVTQQGQCFEISAMSASREDFFENYLSRKFRLSIKESELPLQFKLEFIQKSKMLQNSLIIKSSTLDLKKEELSAQGEIKSELFMLEGRSSQVVCGNNKLSITIYRRGAKYEASFSLVSINESIASSVLIGKGETINVGHILKDLKNKNKALGIPKGLDYQKIEGEETKDFFLKIIP